MRIHRYQQLLVLLLFLVGGFGSVACSSSSAADRGDDTKELTAPKEPTAQEYFLQANEAFDAGDYEGAVTLYEQVTDTDPQRWDAHMNRGIALTALREFRPGTEAFADALHAGGDDHPEVYFNLGNHYQERGFYEAAVDAYRTSMAVAGEVDYETLLNISACFVFLNAHDKARQAIDRAMELDPNDSRARITLGLLTFQEGEREEALEIYDEILAVEPRNPEAHYNRGFILMRMQRNDESITAFETYLDIAPDGPYVRKVESHLSTIENRLQR